LGGRQERPAKREKQSPPSRGQNRGGITNESNRGVRKLTWVGKNAGVVMSLFPPSLSSHSLSRGISGSGKERVRGITL